MTANGNENFTPPGPMRHLVDIVVDKPDDRMLPALRLMRRVDHVVTISEVHHRIDNPARIGFGFGMGFLQPAPPSVWVIFWCSAPSC
jgi:hypothetical protein